MLTVFYHSNCGYCLGENKTPESCSLWDWRYWHPENGMQIGAVGCWFPTLSDLLLKYKEITKENPFKFDLVVVLLPNYTGEME